MERKEQIIVPQNNVHVNLTFGADVKQAKAQIAELNKALSDVAKLPGKSTELFNDAEIKKASQAALELQQHLSKAVNMNTGKLDLSRFSASLKSSNKDLTHYCNSLNSIGIDGKKAFNQLASAISSAETPVLRFNDKLEKMWGTMKNTMRWQISASVMNGLRRGISTAYGYAQDLNESLNNIRIVTGQNVDQMAKFAVEANKAAKALSATTTDYTNASLIYYQQGLSDQQVKERTEVTLKMANVSRQSAEVVSDQMTAIWNNFYDGSKSLEYYGDVITELGARTASSSEEIATGLEKFAAVAETVGLSYEYATSALATVTAETRQSADVVGTAFKTLFARIQDLELGETLDDGVTLGKYSAALDAVGISIMDSNNQLRDMDDILKDMGSKWDTLTKAQQVSLAQTVAGTRQYTQLVALMDNWDKFQENLSFANMSEGTLSDQQDIYAESWEAAADRVRAAAENIYDSLIDDEFFIKLYNGFEKVLETIGGLVDGFGGLGGILTSLGSIFMVWYAQRMPETLNNLRANIMVLTGQASKEMVKIQTQMSDEIAKKSATSTSIVEKAQYTGQQQVLAMRKQLTLASKNLTKAEIAEYEAKIKNIEAMNEEVVAAAKLVEQQQRKFDLQTKTRSGSAYTQEGFQNQKSEMIAEKEALGQSINQMSRKKHLSGTQEADLEFKKQRYIELSAAIEKTTQQETKYLNAVELAKGMNIDTADTIKMATGVQEKYNEAIKTWTVLDDQASAGAKSLDNIMSNKSTSLSQKAEEVKSFAAQFRKSFEDAGISTDKFKKELKELENFKIDGSNFQQLNEKVQQFKTIIESVRNKTGGDVDQFKKIIQGLFPPEVAEQIIKNSNMSAEAIKNLLAAMQNKGGSVADFLPKQTFHASQAFTQLAGAAMSANMMINSVKNAIQIFGDESSTTLEKVGAAISVLMSISMGMNAVSSLGNTLSGTGIALKITDTAITKLQAKATSDLSKEELKMAAATAAANAGLLMSVVIIGLVVAAVYGIVKAIEAYREKSKAFERNLENVSKAVGELTNSYDEARQAIEDFKAEASDYTEALKALSELDESTKAYGERLKEVNQQAKEFIKTYHLTLGEDYSIDNGVITISEDTLDRIEKAKEDTARELEKSLYTLQTIQTTMQNKQKVNTAFADVNETVYKNNLTGMVMMASTPTLDNSQWDTYMESFDADLTQVLDEFSRAYDEIADFDIHSIKGKLDEQLKSIGLSLAELAKQANVDVQTLLNHTDAIEDVIKAQKAAEQANLDYAKSILSIMFEEEQDEQIRQLATVNGVFDANLYEALLLAMEKDVSKKADEFSQEVAKIDASHIQSYAGLEDALGVESLTEEEIFKRYAKAKGLADDAVIDKWYYHEDKGLVDAAGNVMVDNQNLLEADIAQAVYIDAERKKLEEKWKQQEKEEWQGIVDNYNNFVNTSQKANTQYGTDFTNAFLNFKNNENKTFDFTGMLLNQSERDRLSQLGIGEFANMFGIDGKTSRDVFKVSLKELYNAFIDEINNFDEEKYIAAVNAEGEQRAEELGLDVEEFKAYRDLIESTTDAYKDNVEGLNEVALANKRLDKGISGLASDWEDINKAMTDSEITQNELSKIIPTVNENLKEMLNISDEDFSLLPKDFAKKHWDLIQDAVNGVEGAVDVLRNKASEEILLNISAVKDDIELQKVVMDIHNDLLNYDSSLDFKVGINIDDKDFIAKCDAIIQKSKMTQEQAEAYFAAMGYNAEVEEVKITTGTPHTVRWPIYDDPLHPFKVTDWDEESWEDTVTTSAFAVKTITPNGSYGGGIGVNTTSASKPPSSSSSKKQKAKQDSSDRYKEVDDKLDDISETLTDINRELDQAYGTARVAAINKVIKAMEKENEVLEEKLQLAADFQATDKAALEHSIKQGASKFGIQNALVVEDGNITNWYNYWKEVTEKYQEIINSGDETRQEAFEEWMNDAKELADQYTDSSEQLEEISQKIKDNIAEMMSQRYEAWNTEMELEIEISEDSLNRMERMLSRLEDDFYSRAEALALMLEGGEGIQSMANIYSESFGNLDNSFTDLKSLWNTTDEYGNTSISQADYIDGMKAVQQQAEESADALLQWIGEMKEYYADTLNQSIELFNAQMDHVDHLNSVIDHYKNITEILNGEIDYDMTMEILEKQKNNIAAQTESAKSALDMYKEQMRIQKEQMESMQPNSDAYEHAKAEYEAALAAVEQIESLLLEKAEEYANLIKETFTTSLEQFKKDLETALTDGRSFDWINEELEGIKSLTEDWLTATNQVYETNKLINTAQKDLDSTSSTLAKNKLSAFIAETKQLQDSSQLSNFELQVQQKKYDLLLAEIALEDARNAKSTVRLQRDSAGNYGYVYTADADKVADAEQKYADVENELYNLRLDAANDYAEKRLKLDQQLVDDLDELNKLYHVEQVITEEEYNARKDALVNTYYKQVANYSNLYQLATKEDSRVVDEAWSTTYKDIITNTEDCKNEVSNYLDEIESAWNDYQEEVTYLNELIYDSNGEVIDSEEALKNKLEEVDSETKHYADTIKNELIPQLDDQLQRTSDLTNMFQTTMLSAIQGVISKYDELAQSARTAWQEAARLSEVSINGPSVTGINTFVPDDTTTGDRCPVCGNLKSACTCKDDENDGTYYSIDNNGHRDTYESFKKLNDAVSPNPMNYSEVGLEGLKYTAELMIWLAELQAEWIKTHPDPQPSYSGAPGGGGSFKVTVQQFDTGGYTGSWGTSGKLAMLHQKELVLNEQDTSNMLSAVQVVRDIMSTIDIPSLAANLISPTTPTFGTGTLEQVVTIEANFPGVQDRYEIEEAFNNLINSASQFANRKKL